MKRSFYGRYAWPIMIVLGGLMPVVLWGARQAFEHSSNNVYQWLPQDFEQTDEYRAFCRRFGTDDFALVSWHGCTLGDERLERFARRVVPPSGQGHDDARSKWFRDVTTGQRALRTLTTEPFNLAPKEALRRLEGTLVGPDHRTTCALVTLSAAGDANRPAALDALRKIVTTHCGVDPDDLRLGGDAVINAAVDIESERAIRRWIILSWVVAVAVAWVALRSLRLMAMIFVVAVYSSALSTAAIYFTGGTMNLVLVVVPVLIYVLPLSAAVHLSNYYRDAVRESGVAGAPRRALAAGWTPCTLSAVTTALGLISLRASRILPVRMFGLYSALGILMSLGVLFVLLPAALETWPAAGGSAAGGSGNPPGRFRDRLTGRLADWLTRHRRPVVLLCLAGLAFSAGGLALVDTTVAPARFFSPQSRWVQDARWLQRNLGPMVPIEVLLCFDKQGSMSFLEKMELVGQVERRLRGFEKIGGTISPATFAPKVASGWGQQRPDPRIGPAGRAILRALGMGNPEAIYRRILSKRLARNRQRFAATNYLRVDPEQEVWRISARVRAFSQIDHDELLQTVESRIDDFLDQHVPAGQRVEAIYTGIVPLVYLAQRELLDGLFRSFCLAFAMIAVVMIVLLRSRMNRSGTGRLRGPPVGSTQQRPSLPSERRFHALPGLVAAVIVAAWRSVSAGLLAMIPNIFPAVLVFGAMGWMGRLVDVGAMMTASVALGIAVDDTLHFLTWFGRGLRQGQTRQQAIVHAYRRCAPAMTQTTLVAGLGLLVFALSSFQPVSQFGLLMFILLAAALIGDLVLLPAMLATRLGNYFVPNSRA